MSRHADSLPAAPHNVNISYRKNWILPGLAEGQPHYAQANVNVNGFRPLKITRRTGARRPLSRARAADAAHLSPWPEKISRKNRNTFSTSRKIEAASSGAVAMSVLVRSRWKSNMVNPAKMTRPSTE